MFRNQSKGFTLLELLIVIAILAVLSATAMIILNPAELLRKSRDSQRISDLRTIKTAIGYYVVSTSSPFIGGGTAASPNGCKDHSNWYTFSNVSGVVAAGTTANSTTSRAVDGSGWIPVNLSSLTGGSPLGAWPIDPNATVSGGTPGRYYAYICKKDLTFTLFANMESTYYAKDGGGDAEGTDGGSLPYVREEGTIFTLVTATGTNFYASD
jgi:prepilin-type N-terminal cleavage/methylation domain-containing protein